MRLLQKILLFTGALVVALVGSTLAFTTVQADRLARATIRQGLEETREVWQALQADRFNKLRLGVRVLANDPPFKAALVETDQATAFDTMRERGRDLAADFMLATDASGKLVARTDRAGAAADDLGADPIVRRALEGEESATLWRQGDRLFTAVAVPMTIGPELVGTLVAGYGLDEAAATQLRKLTHSEIAFVLQPAGQPPRLAVSSLGAREPALAAALTRPELSAAASEPFEVDLAGERHVGVRIPLRTVAGEEIGAALALRSVAAETAAFRHFRSSLVLVSLGVMIVALLIASAAAARITGPLRTLVGLVERVRDGSYTGAVAVHTRDEIGVLARAFNAFVADLREKDQMIAFLRDGMTALRQATGAGPAITLQGTDGPAALTDAPTLAQSPGGVSGSAALARGQVFAGRYEVLGTLGRGGMGVVYRARDAKLDELVALKMLRPEALASDPSLLERFKQEIRLARRITHKNVLRTHDFDEANGRALHLDGVRGRRHAQGPRPQPRRAAARRRAVERQADVPRPRGGARDGGGSPRHQAAEHDDPAGDRRAEDHGLRDRPRVLGRPRRGPDRRRGGDGHARLHATRAGAGPGRRLPLGHLRFVGRALRDLHRPPAVLG